MIIGREKEQREKRVASSAALLLPIQQRQTHFIS